MAIDGESFDTTIVLRNDAGFVPDVEGHDDHFPLAMTTEHEDGFIEPGDWVVATTTGRRVTDGGYRAYLVDWLDE